MTELERIQHAAALARENRHTESADVRLELAERLAQEPARQADAVVHYLGAAEAYNQVGDYDSAGLCLDAARQLLPHATRFDQGYLKEIFTRRVEAHETGLLSRTKPTT